MNLRFYLFHKALAYFSKNPKGSEGFRRQGALLFPVFPVIMNSCGKAFSRQHRPPVRGRPAGGIKNVRPPVRGRTAYKELLYGYSGYSQRRFRVAGLQLL